MNEYKNEVVAILQEMGKSFEWATWAIEQIDLFHYRQKYFASELASMITANTFMEK